MTIHTSVELILSCSSWQEAQAMSDALFAKHLVTSVEFLPVKTHGHTHAVKLLVQASKANASKIEAINEGNLRIVAKI